MNKSDRKIAEMHKRFGTCGTFRCKDCNHFISGEWHDRHYSKCELYGLSHSEATDWRVSNQACGMFDTDVDLDNWVTIIEQNKRLPKPPPPLDGQISMF